MKVPKIYQGIFDKAYAGSRASAIKAKCLDCTLFQKEEIKHCTVGDCPLYQIRPYQAKSTRN